MYRNVEDISNEIKEKSLPVLFFDTCSILNMLNSIHIDYLPEHYLEIILILLEQHQNDCWLVSCENVYEEWKDNINAVTETLNKEIKRVDRNVNVILKTANSFLGTSHITPPIEQLNIANKIKQLSDDFLKTSFLIQRIGEYSIKAMNRVRKCEAPAKRGKSEPKDCEIIECFLDLCNVLRNKGFSQKIIFFTANKSDFGSFKDIKPPLDSQFNSVHAELITNIEHLYRIVIECRNNKNKTL
ncbi:PIN domain-containing protein [Entomomonas asaccharolytica]|uniref:DUF4935 domain-containing protein n=1 Tax=Entomomonas asaccharolytica TaxID=2785331 RepID=A0A974NFZ6_9GAMM|nr:PIN domain-containing protein [Entomomonas asaccharolytica]QQP86066.1 DUF4935 domain-containing protein [Entomomonas asaccharolytica]